MATPIQPTGKEGQLREAERQARQAIAQLKPTEWATLTEAQRLEVLRRILAYMIRREFGDVGQ